MMFNEYMDHANQCATYYSVVRKDEINLQQNDTNRFKQKWLEVAGGSNVSSSNTYSNNTTLPPNHVSATSKQPAHLLNHQTNLMPGNASASASQSPNQIYINMNQYSNVANSTGKHLYDQSGISVGKSSSNAATLNTGMQQLNQSKQANNLESNQHNMTHQQHIKQQANAQKQHYPQQQIQQHPSVPQLNNQIQYQQKFYEPFIPNLKIKDNSAPNLNANQQHLKQHRQSPSPIILNNNTNINNSGLNQNPNNYSQTSKILNNSYENPVGHKINNAQHGLTNNTLNGVVGSPNHHSNTKLEPKSVQNFNNLHYHNQHPLLHQHQTPFHNQVYPNSQLQQQFNNNKSNTSYHQSQQGYHLNQQHQTHHHQQHQYQASQDYSFDLNSPRVNSPLNPSISNYTINSVNSSNSDVLTSSSNLDSTSQHSSDGATYVKKISPCMLPQQKLQQTKTEQTKNNLILKSPTPLATHSMSTHVSNSIDVIYNNCLNENNQASMKSPRIIVNSPSNSSLNTSLSVSTPLNTQGNLTDLNQDQLVADDCDSNLLSPLNNQNSMKTTISKTLSSSSISASLTNDLSQSNSSERTSNISNSSFSNSKSILSEINIDELFTHYPNVFEELFYSFKLNSIEQIEHELRTYCEQQFKLNISTKNTNCQSSNSTQKFSIRI